MKQITSIFIGQGKIMSHHLKIINSQYLSEFWMYGPDVLHVIITFKGFKITFNNTALLESFPWVVKMIPPHI